MKPGAVPSSTRSHRPPHRAACIAPFELNVGISCFLPVLSKSRIIILIYDATKATSGARAVSGAVAREAGLGGVHDAQALGVRILSGSSLILVAGLVTLVAGSAQAQDHMQMDVMDCQRIATQSTGYNPAQAAPAQSTAPPAGSPRAGGRLRGAAVGAAAGAARAEVRGEEYQAYDQSPYDGEAGIPAERGPLRPPSGN